MRLMADLAAVIVGKLIESDFTQPGEVAAFVAESVVRLESGYERFLHSFGGGFVVPTRALEKEAEKA